MGHLADDFSSIARGLDRCEINTEQTVWSQILSAILSFIRIILILLLLQNENVFVSSSLNMMCDIIKLKKSHFILIPMDYVHLRVSKTEEHQLFCLYIEHEVMMASCKNLVQWR